MSLSFQKFTPRKSLTETHLHWSYIRQTMCQDIFCFGNLVFNTITNTSSLIKKMQWTDHISPTRHWFSMTVRLMNVSSYVIKVNVSYLFYFSLKHSKHRVFFPGTWCFPPQEGNQMFNSKYFVLLMWNISLECSECSAHYANFRTYYILTNLQNMLGWVVCIPQWKVLNLQLYSWH